MIALGSDHGGWALKQEVMKHLDARGLEYKDYGTYSEDSCDYPVYGKAVAHAVADGECEKGIIICGTGIGMAMTANKVKGAYAAVCHDIYSAQRMILSNDGNILCMGALVIGMKTAEEMVRQWLPLRFDPSSASRCRGSWGS